MMGRCRRIRKKLPLLLGGELERAEQEDVREHVEQCAACAGELQRLRAAIGQLARLAASDNAAPWPSICSAVLDQLQVMQRSRHRSHDAARSRWRRRWIMLAAVSAASLAVLVVLQWTRWMRPSVTPSELRVRPPAGSVSAEDAPSTTVETESPVVHPQFVIERATVVSAGTLQARSPASRYVLDMADPTPVTLADAEYREY